MIIYKQGSLFDAPKGSWLVHACNAQGVWGSGIAKEFKVRFPKSFREYNQFCTTPPGNKTGMSFLTSDNVGCLITSNNYGSLVDPPRTVIENTVSALDDFFRTYVFDDRPVTIHSNKFNSNLFKVPWEETEKVLMQALGKHTNVEWVVWEYNG